jgi:hypothetical protein
VISVAAGQACSVAAQDACTGVGEGLWSATGC